jgi:hypothetical protein
VGDAAAPEQQQQPQQHSAAADLLEQQLNRLQLAQPAPAGGSDALLSAILQQGLAARQDRQQPLSPGAAAAVGSPTAE